ncbi:hypothetical protein H1C71_012010 [Ictidomys tridecemlineatus]|nr:hypothetical protein H1C71_012010 [Ictidomys tridecemlineatus]
MFLCPQQSSMGIGLEPGPCAALCKLDKASALLLLCPWLASVSAPTLPVAPAPHTPMGLPSSSFPGHDLQVSNCPEVLFGLATYPPLPSWSAGCQGCTAGSVSPVHRAWTGVVSRNCSGSLAVLPGELMDGFFPSFQEQLWEVWGGRCATGHPGYRWWLKQGSCPSQTHYPLCFCHTCSELLVDKMPSDPMSEGIPTASLRDTWAGSSPLLHGGKQAGSIRT